MNYRMLFLMIAGITAYFNAAAQEREIIHLWKDVPGETGPKKPHELSDDTSRDVTRISRVSDPVLHVYRPAPGKNRGAGIIVCPGGGYSILAIDLEGHEVAAWLADLGFTAFVLEYRVPKKPLNALQDFQRAVRVVRSRAEEWGIQSGKVGAIGFSAGGDLVARGSSFHEKKLYPPQDKADSLTAKPSFSLLIYPAYLDKGENRSITPDLEIGSDYPPVFLFATADDSHGNSTLVMAGALRDAKVPAEQHLYTEGGHGYGLRPGNPAADAWPGLAAKWLSQLGL
ncbi:alpha/beta hydrolase [Anseongella ginsenosidimutans]|nr:alpha/beta hydrolase [Anseongella ginsenosidimutans]QEC53537.1 alpha/beta hydrolase [Anseongella ginsenosidimutans]